MAFGDAPFDDDDDNSPPLSLLEPYRVREDGTLVSLDRRRETGEHRNGFCELMAEMMLHGPLMFSDGYSQSSQRYSFAKLASAAARDEEKRCKADHLSERMLAIVRPEKEGEVDGIVSEWLRLAEVAEEPRDGDDWLMPETFSFCVMLQMETHDARLSQAAIVEALESGRAGEFAKLRHAVLQHLPKDVTRLVAVFPPEHAKMLMMLHELHGEDIGKFLREQGIAAEGEGGFVRPPPDYVPPTRD